EQAESGYVANQICASRSARRCIDAARPRLRIRPALESEWETYALQAVFNGRRWRTLRPCPDEGYIRTIGWDCRNRSGQQRSAVHHLACYLPKRFPSWLA